MQLDDRKKRILGALVDCYVATGEPVGSKLLAGVLNLHLSSATIRNEMSELAEMGLLEQPHTSAGRIPSQAGYRYYVDSLMDVYPLTLSEQARINVVLRIDGSDLDSVLSKAGDMLAAITGCVAVSAAPRANIRIRSVEVMPAGKRSMLIVLVASPGVLRSRLCKAGQDVDTDMLAYFTNLLRDKLLGLPPEAATPELKSRMERALAQYAAALRPVLEAVFDELGVLSDAEVFLGGETNLFCYPEFHDGSALEIIHFLEQREQLFKLVDDVHGPVNVRIGTENGTDSMRSSSLIAAPYKVGGRPQGSVGIIGPIRMNYAKLVSHIEYFSSVLSKLISDTFPDE
ncbi:heat-inducible transcriptional repressor HrcA [Ethanoligenens sp.]|uniref:heat-inducible transcriptional repressor HrcA n=1 Tax=Ethanoligenens sp. TaxID=2099655 RepID=UPI0039ECFF77